MPSGYESGRDPCAVGRDDTGAGEMGQRGLKTAVGLFQ